MNFQSILRGHYGTGLEYTENYVGGLGSRPAEIYYPGSCSAIQEIIAKINALNLVVKPAKIETVQDKMTAILPEGPVDVISSNCGCHSGQVQLVFTNQRALDIFKRTFTACNAFENLLRDRFGRGNYFGNDLEYKEPYSGVLGSHVAEIFHPTNAFAIGQIIELLQSLNLEVKPAKADRVEGKTVYSPPEGPVDVISSNCGFRGGQIQLVFTNQRALDIFKNSIQIR